MQYYNVWDVMEITGVGKSKAYDIIRNLCEMFKIDYPDSITIQGQIIKWYFDEKMGIKKCSSEEEQKNII